MPRAPAGLVIAQVRFLSRRELVFGQTGKGVDEQQPAARPQNAPGFPQHILRGRAVHECLQGPGQVHVFRPFPGQVMEITGHYPAAFPEWGQETCCGFRLSFAEGDAADFDGVGQFHGQVGHGATDPATQVQQAQVRFSQVLGLPKDAGIGVGGGLRFRAYSLRPQRGVNVAGAAGFAEQLEPSGVSIVVGSDLFGMPVALHAET